MGFYRINKEPIKFIIRKNLPNLFHFIRQSVIINHANRIKEFTAGRGKQRKGFNVKIVIEVYYFLLILSARGDRNEIQTQ